MDKVFKAIPDLYFRLDTGNKIVDYNALEDSDLYSAPGEFIGKKIEDIFPLKLAEQFEKAIEEARKTKSLVKVEYSLPMPDGKKEYEARLLTFRKDHIIVVVHDISERKKMEEALKTYQFYLEEIIEARTVDLKIANEKLKVEIDERIRIGKALKESEEKFRLIFNRGNDAKFVHPLSEKGMGHFIEVNEIACKRLGYSKEELLRLSPKDISHSDSFKKAPDLMRKLNKDGRVVFEAVHITKDGRDIPVEISSQVFTLNKKKMILSIARDISERKKKEEEIKKQNIFLKNVIESLNHPFYVIDAIDYKVKMANSYSGLQKGIPCYKPTHHLDKPCGMHGKACPLKMIKEKKRSVTVEHVHFDKDGKERFVEVHGHPILDSEENVIQMIEYTIDISERKRAEMLLQQRLKMAQIINSISTMFNRMNMDELDNGIDQALYFLGEFAGADRSYVFLISEDGTTADNTHEWCAEGIEPNIHRMKMMPVEAFSFFSHKLENFETFCVPRILDLPPEAEAEKKELRAQGITSMLCVPMNYRKKLIGFIGFLSIKVEKEWTEDDIRLLDIIGNVISNAIIRKKDREKIQKSEERYRTLVDMIPYGIEEIDTTGTITLCNKAHREILGYEYDELIGKKIWDFAASEKEKEEYSNYFLLLVKEQPNPTPFFGKNVRKDGREIDVRVDWDYRPDEEGRLTGFIGVVTDITEQKRVFEEANTLANVIRQTTDCIVLTDLDGNIQYVNPMFEKITGYTFEEVKGKNPRILRSENAAYPSGFYEKLWDTIGNGNIWNGEFINKKKNGEDYIEEASIFPVRDQQTGEIICYGAVKKDITLRRELEEKLKKSYKEVVSLKEKAESASRLKSQFLANMSHDIRTPLNTIMGFANLLLKSEQREVQRDYLKKIEVSGQGLLNLINDILDFSKIEAGQLDIYKRTFLLKDLMESIGSIFEIQFKKKKIDFEKNIAKNVPDMVYNDKWRMSQVLVNLLSNALKFTDEGNVSIHTGYKKSKDRIVFKVKDTGVGIAKKYFEKIFEPFSQVYSSETFDKKGTGLGLAICKNLTTLLGGDLTVHSKPGVGSEFTFEIPANSDKIESRREAAIDNRVMERKMDIEVKKDNKILIAEDNLVNQVLLVEQFKNEGFDSILIAENGREAIDVASEQTPDLILMDIQMPVMNGNEAIAELKKRGYQGPILALSALARREDIEKSLEAGAVDYITKPIDFDKFFFQISKYLKVKQNKKETVEAKRRSNKIKESASQRVRNAYIKDAKEKLKVIKGILKNKNFEERKRELKVIAHGYKGNARYLGLDNLEIAAKVLDNGLNNDESDNIIWDLTQKMADILKSIIEENS